MTELLRADELCLRFTEREAAIDPPDVRAFAGDARVVLREQLVEHDDRTALTDLIAAGMLATRTRVVFDSDPSLARQPVFVTMRATPIPAIELPSLSSLLGPDPAPFAISDRVDGHFAWIPTARSRSRAAALVLAVTIPLALPDVAAAQSPSVQRPVTAPDTVPEPPPPAASPPATPAPAPTPAPADAQAVRPSRPTPQLNPALLQTILDSMKGREVILFARGGKVNGLLVGVDGDFATIIDYDHDGKIAMIPKSEVLEVRGRVKKPPPPEMPTGNGAIAGGSVLIAIGAPTMLSGLVFFGLGPSYLQSVYLPQIVPAAVMLGAGIPLLIKGLRNRRIYRAASAGWTSRISPTVGPTRGGWTGGLTLRF